MGILDEPTAVTWSDLDATYALKPDNGARAVGQGELVLNVRDFGAKGDGVTDDTAALNAALAASVAGGTLLLPAGTYKTTAPLVLASGITIRGAGRKLTRIDNAASDVLSISGENYVVDGIGFRSRPGGGHVMSIPGGSCLAQSAFRDLELNQANNAKSLIRYDGSGTATGGGLFDCHFSDFYFQHIPTATVPGVNVYSDNNNVFSANRFSRGRCLYSGAFFFDIQIDTAATYAYNNVWDSINFEVCNGGGIRLMSAMNNGLHNLGFFDNGVVTADCIQIGRLGGTPARGQSRGNTISNYHRSKGMLSGAKDINLVSGGNNETNNIIGISGPASAGITVDLGASSGYATVIGYDAKTVTIQNVSPNNTTLVSGSAGITTPSLFVAGNNVDGRSELFLIKAADTKVRNSTRRTADPHLAATVEAGGVYMVEAFLVYRSSASADLSISWALPSGATLTWVADGPRLSTASPNAIVARSALGSASSKTLGGTATDVVAIPRGILRVGATAGALKLLWGQAKAESSDTIMRADSYLLVTRVG